MTKHIITVSIFFGVMIGSIVILPFLALAQNTVSFDNQSGEPALVKLLGPTSKEIEVPTGAKNTIEATTGKYIIKVRYGRNGKYRYTKGEEFDVTETATTKSSVTITLHKVAAGNYEATPISKEDFSSSVVGSTTAPAMPAKTIAQAKEPKTLSITGGKQYKAVNNDSALQEYLNRTLGVELSTTDGGTVKGFLMKASSGHLFIESSGDLWVMPRTNDPEAAMSFMKPTRTNIELLISILGEKDTSNQGDSKKFREKAIEALGDIGDIRARPQLSKIAEGDSDPELRAVAQSALKKLRRK